MIMATTFRSDIFPKNIVFFDHPFQLFVEIRKKIFQLFVDVYTQNTPPYHRSCVADLFFAYPLGFQVLPIIVFA